MTTSMIMKSATREEIARALKSGGEHIGDIVWTDLEGIDAARVRREDMRQLLRDVNLPEMIAGEDTSPAEAFGRAVSDWRDNADAFVVQRPKKRAHGLAHLYRRVNGGATLETAAVLGFLSGGITHERGVAWGDECEAHVETFRRAFAAHREYIDHAELGGIIVTAIRDHFGGVRLKRSGHVYWTPPTSTTDVDAFARVIGTIGSSAVTVLRVADGAGNGGAIGGQLGRSLAGDVATMAKNIDTYLAKSKSEERAPRAGSLQARIDHLDELTARVDVARTLLGAWGATLDAAIADASKTVRAALVDAVGDVNDDGDF